MKTNDTSLAIKILSAAGRGRCIIISSFTGCELARAHIHESFHAACTILRRQQALAHTSEIRPSDHTSNVHPERKTTVKVF